MSKAGSLDTVNSMNGHTVKEEIANAITHGIGAVLSVVALVALVVYSAEGADPYRIVGVSIFGATMLLMYCASTLYHAFPHPNIKHVMRICDHCSIYLLIAGTYTPICLVSMRGPWGWTMLAILWGIALFGCIFKLFFVGRCEKFSVGLYVAMGWMAVIAIKPTLEMVPGPAMIMMALGGLTYTSGVIFYLWDRLPYNHAIWHLFVLGGSTMHFLAIFWWVLPVPVEGAV